MEKYELNWEEITREEALKICGEEIFNKALDIMNTSDVTEIMLAYRKDDIADKIPKFLFYRDDVEEENIKRGIAIKYDVPIRELFRIIIDKFYAKYEDDEYNMCSMHSVSVLSGCRKPLHDFDTIIYIMKDCLYKAVK